MARETHHQPSLPGINADEIRRQELLKKFPRPVTKELATMFYRKFKKDKERVYSVQALIAIQQDHDLLRVVLKTKDGDDDDVKFEKKAELPHDDPEEYDRLYIKRACEAWDCWIANEELKL